MGVLDPAPTQAPFSILGLLLGGRSYGANYFAQRDALTQQANERARIGQAAQGLLATPEYKQVFNTPELQAAGALWAKQQPDFSAMGNNLLSQKIGSIYQSESQQQGAALQEKQLRLSDTLERQRMGISMDDSLKMDEIKRQRDLADQGITIKNLLAIPGAAGQSAAITKMTGINPPQDYLFTGGLNADGTPAMAMIPHSPTHIKALEELSPLKNSADATKILSDMASGTVPFDQGLWNATRNQVVESLVKGKGSYDEGLEKLINQLLPDKDWKSTDLRGNVATQLKIQADVYAKKAANAASKWGISLDNVPSDLAGLRPTSPPPSESPNAAQNQLKKDAESVPATTRQGRYNPSVGGILLNQDPGYKPTTRSRTGQPIGQVSNSFDAAVDREVQRRVGRGR